MENPLFLLLTFHITCHLRCAGSLKRITAGLGGPFFFRPCFIHNRFVFTGQEVIRHSTHPVPAGKIVHLGFGPKALQNPERIGMFRSAATPCAPDCSNPKGNGAGRAGFRTRCLIFPFFQFTPIFRIRLILGAHEPVMAESTFFHDTPHSGETSGVSVRSSPDLGAGNPTS
jgi:hypothetical protein